MAGEASDRGRKRKKRGTLVPRRDRGYWEREGPVQLWSGVAGVGGALAMFAKAVLFDHDLLNSILAGISLVGGGASTAIKVAQGEAKDAAAEEKENPLDLTACLHVIRAGVLHLQGVPNTETNKTKLRVTIHDVIDDEWVEQVVPYVGSPSPPDTVGRRLSRRSGVVGRAITTGEIAVMNRRGASHDDYVDELKRAWHVPEHEARNLTPGRFSFMGLPLIDESRAKGVVFFDSSEPKFFTKAVQEFAAGACTGIAEYVRFRYGKR